MKTIEQLQTEVTEARREYLDKVKSLKNEFTVGQFVLDPQSVTFRPNNVYRMEDFDLVYIPAVDTNRSRDFQVALKDNEIISAHTYGTSFNFTKEGRFEEWEIFAGYMSAVVELKNNKADLIEFTKAVFEYWEKEVNPLRSKMYKLDRQLDEAKSEAAQKERQEKYEAAMEIIEEFEKHPVDGYTVKITPKQIKVFHEWRRSTIWRKESHRDVLNLAQTLERIVAQN